MFITGYSVLRMEKEDISRKYKEFIHWKGGRRIDLDARLVHLAAFHAIEMAGVELGRIDRSRIGIVFGTSFGGLESYEEFFRSIHGNPQPSAFSNTSANIPASVISIFYGVTGPSITLSGGSLVGVEGLILSMEMIDSGLCDMVITGAWYMPSLSSMGLVSASHSGAGVIIIESPRHAERRSANIIGRIKDLSTEVTGEVPGNANSTLVGESVDEYLNFYVGGKGDDIPGVSSLLTVIKGLERIQKNNGTGRVIVNIISRGIVSLSLEGKRGWREERTVNENYSLPYGGCSCQVPIAAEGQYNG